MSLLARRISFGASNMITRLPLWSAVIPTYGKKGLDLTRDCLQSMLRNTERREIIVVDDGSEPAVQEKLARTCEELDAKLVTRPENGGFAKATNQGILEANGRVVILVNNDTRVIGKTMDDLANFILFTGAATVGCKLLYEDGSVQHGGVCYVPAEPLGYFDHIGRFEQRYAPSLCRIRNSLSTGAMLAINCNAIDSVGLLDERYGMAFEDLDYQMRCMETGFRIFYCGIIEAYHLEGQTRGRTPAEKAAHSAWTEAEERARELFFERWDGVNFQQFQIGAQM